MKPPLIVGTTAVLPLGRADAGATIASAVERSTGEHFHLVNAFTIVSGRRSSDVAAALADSKAVNLPDGNSIVFAARMLSAGAFPTCRGPSLFATALAGEFGAFRHFLLGGSPEVLERLTVRARALDPASLIVGTHSPPFREVSPDDITHYSDIINASGADLVWVGLGTPKQDLVAAQLSAHSGVVCVAVGAAFDFLAGSKREAPEFLQALRLEWLFRLASEPRRLWRRYTIDGLEFLHIVRAERRRRRLHLVVAQRPTDR